MSLGIGGVLIGRELLGLWPTVTLAYGVVLGVYCGPTLARRLADGATVRRARRTLRDL